MIFIVWVLVTALVHEGAAFLPKRPTVPFQALVGGSSSSSTKSNVGSFRLWESTISKESALEETEKDVIEEEAGGKCTLQFRADINTESSALPYSSREKVEAFFTCPDNRNLFITAGGKREYEKVESSDSDALLASWTRICAQEGNAIPDESDEIFTVKTGGISFPGLTLETRATMGIKLVEKESGPTYEVTLIGDDRRVKGLPPVVYIFNKLTGGGGDASVESGSSDNVSTTNIICEFNQESSNVTFKTSTQFTINIRFPSILMKIIPTSKEKAEEQGSQAITKAVGKDVEQSMVVFEEAYRKAFT